MPEARQECASPKVIDLSFLKCTHCLCCVTAVDPAGPSVHWGEVLSCSAICVRCITTQVPSCSFNFLTG
jgi:hypothetical protein